MKNSVHILGAGLAGMIAAIDLAKQGYEVIVLEKAKNIGGVGAFHPSIHGTPIDIERTSDYIGIDIRSCFYPFTEFRSYFGKTGYNLDPTGLYAVERSGREKSIDAFLFNIAQDSGVKFEFSQNIKNHRELPAGSIIATGLYPGMYTSLNIPKSWFYGAIPRFETTRPTELVSIFDDTIGDYYYHGVANGLLFGHLFQRTRVPEKAISQCREFLMEKEGFPNDAWMPTALVMPGWSLKGPKLFIEDKILAGTISGMIDPIMGFGIVGAMYSGKIAAMAVYNPEQAMSEFKTFTKNWHANFISRKVMDRIPFRTKLQELFMVKAPEKIRQKMMESSKLTIPGVDVYPMLKPI